MREGSPLLGSHNNIIDKDRLGWSSWLGVWADEYERQKKSAWGHELLMGAWQHGTELL